ncbi:putative hydrolase of the HAD superfamily [Luteibacter sp. UNCMF331Sha3.1]|uniref:HAD family hydrolase n=1 Tax=Luteibacter sp. UNCMF331Sha3.1 TaxID=1502760 RepID=UPI0008BD58E5|nr:HAD family hydrolase [Luteibacter sp. UNCMF331Sha3.1]SEM37093.1 putative hydrolase of the HAD superfamily [Luteibacter sp. UNCMF331Sha3.1]
MIDLVGFDGDDTLWRSQEFYDDAQASFEAILGRYVDLASDGLRDALLATERGNIALFGYGAKGMTLSMIESAIELTDGRIEARDIHRIVRLGKDVLAHPVELLPGIRDAVTAVAATHRVVLITKGDLFHQEYKVARSGLADIFHRIEIVSEKDPAAYRRLFAEFDIPPARFAMVGNSLKSDIAPVVELGGWGVYMPYHSTWAHELVDDFAMGERVIEVAGANGVPEAIARMHSSVG